MDSSPSPEFRVLGSFEVFVDGQAVELGGAKPRLVLATLVLHANTVVPAERLIDIVWADDPPDTARSTLRKYVYRLRSAIAPHHGSMPTAGVLRTCAPGYELQVDPEQVDADRFERLVAAARLAAARGELESASNALEEALSLWRGPAWAEFADRPFARAEITRLEELRVIAFEERAELGLAAGHHAELIGELEATASQYPLRETPHAQLMLALYRSGRHAESLRVYQAFRRALIDEAGLEPSAALQRIELDIIRRAPGLDRADRDDHDDRAELERDTPRARPQRAATFPPSLAVVTDPPFVGRDAELERIQTTWKRAVAGDRQIVLIGGEPGIGKSRLAAELAFAARDDGAVVLHGRCDDGMGVPYQAFVEALRQDVDQSTGAELSARLGRYGGELVRLVPDLADRVTGLPACSHSDPETDQYRLFEAVTDWLAARSKHSAALLVLDDLHWAATPTLLLLRHIVRSTPSTCLMIIGTYRASELTRATAFAGLLAELRSVDGVVRVDLDGLDEYGVRAFMTGVAGRELDDAGQLLAKAVHARTSGNPFFVGEVLQNLVESGAIVERDGRWVRDVPLDELSVPAGVREVVRSRVDRLAPSTRDMLAFAAVIGPEFDVAVVARLVDVDDDALLAALDDAVASALLREAAVGRYRFAHALVRATLYDEVSATRRAHMHGKVGDAIEHAYAARLDEHLAELARHFTLASPYREAEKAVEYSTRAAERALAQLAPHEAARFYRDALALLAKTGSRDDGRRCDLLIAMGDAQRRSGDSSYLETLLEAADIAQSLNDADRLARAALTARIQILTYGEPRQRAVLEAALAAVGGEDSPVRARLLAAVAAQLEIGDERRFELSEDALAIARRVGDTRTLVEVLEQRMHSVRRGSNLAHRSALASEAAELVGNLADPSLAWQVAWQCLSAAWEIGDRDFADRQFELLNRLSRELAQPAPRYYATLGRATRAMMEGAPDEVEPIAAEALALGREAGQLDPVGSFASTISMLRRFQDRLPELVEDAVRWVTSYPQTLMPGVQSGLAWMYCGLERLEDARAIFERFAADDFPFGDDALWMQTMIYCAEVCANLEDVARAEIFYERLVPSRDHFVVPDGAWMGSVAHYLGLLATTMHRFDVADADFAHAAAGYERLGARPWLALTRLEWARMLLTRDYEGDTERAHVLLDEARLTAQALGIPMIDRRARALLR